MRVHAQDCSSSSGSKPSSGQHSRLQQFNIRTKFYKGFVNANILNKESLVIAMLSLKDATSNDNVGVRKIFTHRSILRMKIVNHISKTYVTLQ